MALSVLCTVYASLGNWERLSAVAGDAIEAVERDRYRVNAPYLQASYLSGYLDVFVAGILPPGSLATMAACHAGRSSPRATPVCGPWPPPPGRRMS